MNKTADFFLVNFVFPFNFIFSSETIGSFENIKIELVMESKSEIIHNYIYEELD